MIQLIRFIDRIAMGLAALGKLALFLLICAMVFEVIARYGFGAPTLWAFDISYMMNGSIFLLGAAYALKVDAHVRIDFLSQKMPLRFQQLLNGVLYIFIMAPVFGIFSFYASKKAIHAVLSGEVESVSPWVPYMWPFYSVIAIGLIAFTLQFIAEGLKYLMGQRRPGEGAEHAEMEGMSS